MSTLQRDPIDRMWGCPVFRHARRARTAWAALLAAMLMVWAAPHPAALAAGPPLDFPAIRVDILDAQRQRAGRANVYLNFVELADATGAVKGAIGVVLAEGKASLFLVQSDSERRLIGWAEDHRLYNAENKLIGYYVWTPIWSYVYDEKLKKVGQAQCIAYQGVCAAGIAGYLLGLF